MNMISRKGTWAAVAFSSLCLLATAIAPPALAEAKKCSESTDIVEIAGKVKTEETNTNANEVHSDNQTGETQESTLETSDASEENQEAEIHEDETNRATFDDVSNTNIAYVEMTDSSDISPNAITLTFKYGTAPASGEGISWWTIASSYTDLTEWGQVAAQKQCLIVIDSSFASYQPISTAWWFDGIRLSSGLEGLTNLDTSKTTSMNHMFANSAFNSEALADIVNLNTQNVTDMSYMFSTCYIASTLNLSLFQTSNVEDMNNMFAYCSSLASLDLSAFDTANVTNMAGMFAGDTGLQDLKIASFNTQKVKDMSDMFNNCYGLKSIDMSSFNTGNVEDMSRMFYNTHPDSYSFPQTFITSKVKKMNHMFAGCLNGVHGSATSIDLSTFTSESLEDCSYMFYACDGLEEINLGALTPPTGFGSTAMFMNKNMTGPITTIQKITLSSACNLTPGALDAIGQPSGTFFDYKEPGGWVVYSNNTSGTAPSAINVTGQTTVIGYDAFRAYQIAHPGMITFGYTESPDVTPDVDPDITPASDSSLDEELIPNTGDITSLAIIACALLLGSATVFGATRIFKRDMQ